VSGLGRVKDLLLIVIVPREGKIKPAIRYSKVDFPQPDGPITAHLSDVDTFQEKSWNIEPWFG
jgi:hypothetical protein